MTSEPEEWVAAREAVALVSNGREYSRDGLTSLCRRAHAGLIRARATLFVRREGNGAIEFEDWEVPRDFWWAEGDAALEQDWDRGDFSTWINEDVKLSAFGVRFDATGINTLLGLVSREAVTHELAPFSDEERRDWIAKQEQMTADNAHKLFKQHPRFDGTKPEPFRKEWKEVRGTKRGRPPISREQ